MLLLPRHQEDNPRGQQTILFIHSPLSTGHQWAGVLFHLQTCGDFHVLIACLRAGDLSSSSRAVSLLANLIREKAQRRVAHVVASGAGAHIAVLLAQDNESLVSTLFVSGYRDWSLCERLALPYVIFAVHKLRTRGTLLPSFSLDDCRALARLLREDQDGRIWAPGMIIATFRSFRSWPPCRAALRLQQKLDSTHNVSVKVARGLGRGWNRHDPAVFASAVHAFITQAWDDGLDDIFEHLK
jgi:pimeloyl-ACP methyl ester carboxylesterase